MNKNYFLKIIFKNLIEIEKLELNMFKNCYKNDVISMIFIENNMMILRLLIVKVVGYYKDFF